MKKKLETIDWETEGRRVADAFELELKGQWEKFEIPEITKYYFNCGHDKFGLPLGPEGQLKISVAYVESGIEILPQHEIGVPYYDEAFHLFLGWDGSVIQNLNAERFGEPLAKALFHLNLLNPEIEAALQVTVSDHQKIEWTLAHDEWLAAKYCLKQ